MKSKNFLKGAKTGGVRLNSRKLFLLAGLIILIVCFAFFACDLPEDDDITSIKIDKSTLAIPAGDADYLTVTTVPANAAGVIWTSNDTSIVTVSNGIVKANQNAAGKSTTVVAKNASGKVTSSCAITVTGEPSGTQVSSVSLSRPIVVMTVGETENITSSISPDNAYNKAVFWTSSNLGVARVNSSSGSITAVAAGTAVITVTTKNKGRTATCNVTVNSSGSGSNPPPAEIPVTSITISSQTLSLEVGKTGNLTVTAQPSNASDYIVTWTSDSTSIATVEDGLVTAVAAGTAKITATVGAYTDICTVTVTAATGINLSPTNLTLFTTGGNNISTALITATVPGTVTSGSAVTWTSSATTVATVTASTTGIGATVSAVAKGTATITATVDNKTGTCIVTVVDPADYYGIYSTKYKNSANKEITEYITISKDLVGIADSDGDYIDLTVNSDGWAPATSPNADYPIALKISGKITDAKPKDSKTIYGTTTAPNFNQSDINTTPCWMYIYINSSGDILRSPLSKGTANNTAPIASNNAARVYKK